MSAAIAEVKPLYVGATTCEFAPAFRDTCPELLAMARACYEADPDEQTPWLMLADMLQERTDPREAWVRAGSAMWSASAGLEIGKRTWDYNKTKTALGSVCQTGTGSRVACLWGCLVAWHAPAGDDTGMVMGRTWVDERVRVVQRSLWLWALGFLETNPLDDAAGHQAYAAWHQADVWRFARTCWEKVCVPQLKLLGAAERSGTE